MKINRRVFALVVFVAVPCFAQSWQQQYMHDQTDDFVVCADDARIFAVEEKLAAQNARAAAVAAGATAEDLQFADVIFGVADNDLLDGSGHEIIGDLYDQWGDDDWANEHWSAAAADYEAASGNADFGGSVTGQLVWAMEAYDSAAGNFYIATTMYEEAVE